MRKIACGALLRRELTGGGKDGGEIVYAGPRVGSGASRYTQGSGLSTYCTNESRMGPERPGGRFG